MESQRVGHDWATFTFTLLRTTASQKLWEDLFQRGRGEAVYRYEFFFFNRGNRCSQAFVVVVVRLLSCVQLFYYLMYCSPTRLSVHGIPRQEYWSRLPFPSPADLPDRDQIPVSCIGRWILYHWPLGKSKSSIHLGKRLLLITHTHTKQTSQV